VKPHGGWPSSEVRNGQKVKPGGERIVRRKKRDGDSIVEVDEKEQRMISNAMLQLFGAIALNLHPTTPHFHTQVPSS